MNFQCDSNHPGYVIADRLFQELKLSSCDDRINDDDKFTFVNEKLGCKSFIDHIFMSADLKASRHFFL